MTFRILASTRFFDADAERFLLDHGCEVRRSGLSDEIQDDTIAPQDLDRLLDGMDGWIVGTAPVTRNILMKHPELKIVARRGVGYDTVDTAAARELGRRVTISPGGNEPAVADHAVAMMLAVAKRLREGQLAMQADHWAPLVGTELCEKTVGLVGFGRIAQAVGRRVRGFDANVLAYDPYPNESAAETIGARFVEMAELLAKSDYISLHLPLSEQTRYLFDRETMLAMRPGAILINTARGGLIDEVALVDLLASKHLMGAGLDVFEGEADPSRRDQIKTLIELPNVIASAHSAGSSREGLSRTNRLTAKLVLDVLSGREPPADYVVV